jgi:hypothetical protein
VVLAALVIAGAWPIVSVKFCVAFVPTPLLAVNVMGKVPVAPAVPLSVPELFPLSTNVTPAGSAPDSVRDAVGTPVAVTVNDPAAPTVNVALVPLVIAGAWSTVSVKVCVASVPITLCALMLSEYVLPVNAAGVPASVAVPFPLSTNVTPVGSAPVSVSAGSGKPVVVTVKVPAWPTVNVVLAALVIAGAWPIVSVKFCVALLPTPLLAVNVMGKVPVAPAVPLSVPELFPLSTNVTPAGSVPDSVRDAVGTAVAVTVNDPATPAVNAVLLPLMIAGAWLTVMLKLGDVADWWPAPIVPARPTLESVTVTVKLEVPVAVGVPVIAPVLPFRCSPAGNDPLLEYVSAPAPPVSAIVWL